MSNIVEKSADISLWKIAVMWFLWVDEMMPNVSLLKYPYSTWRLQHLLCGNKNTPVWIKAWVEAVWGMLKSLFRFIAGLYNWFFNMRCFFTFTVIHFDFSIYSCTEAIAYNIDIGHIATHNFFYMMPETDSWRDMSPWVLLASLKTQTAIFLLFKLTVKDIELLLFNQGKLKHTQ